MKLLVICGATATGKTELAVDCALKLKTEVISADSQLIYKGLDIGTAKPTAAEMRGVKHYMIDVVEPESKFSVFDYAQMAEPILDRLFKANQAPLICGGTGFYINSLLFDYSYGNTAENKEIREKYTAILQNMGKEYLFNLLKESDPQTAAKLNVNDTKRVIRALEIYEASGKKKSDIKDTENPRRDYLAVAVDYPRQELYERIDKRVNKMITDGLVEEVQSLLKNGISENNQCMQAIGYKEVVQFLKNGYNHSTMCDIIKQNTRHYAKRQITFFKKLKGIVWLKPEEATSERVLDLYNE